MEGIVMLNKLGFIGVIVILSFGLSAIAGAKTLYETDFSKGAGDWDLIAKGGKITLDKDNTAPVHGPDVLILDDTAAIDTTPTLAYIKNLVFTDGIIQILWKDGRLPEDTDGPITARAQNEEFMQSYDFELDTDTGLHVEAGNAPNNQNVIDATKQPNLISTGDWTWMKVRLEGNHLQVKAWLATGKEPDAWNIDWVDPDSTYVKGNVGLRAWSGQCICAYYLVTDLTGALPVEQRGKLSTTWGELKRSY
jgi:hypothetical protein